MRMKDIAQVAPVAGVVVFAFTVVFAFIYWMNEIIAAMEAVPGVIFIGILVAFGAVSAGAVLWGGEDVRALGTTGLLILTMSTGLTLALTLSEYLATYIVAVAPGWSPVVWLALGVGTAVVLVSGGLASHWWLVKA